MEDNPFNFKGLVKGGQFFDRNEECSQIESYILSKQHILLMAPRRFGKSSLLWHLKQGLDEEHHIISVYIDLFKCATLEEYVRLVGRALIAAQETKWQKFMTTLKRSLPSLAPKVVLNAQGEIEFLIHHEPEEANLNTLEQLLVWFDHYKAKARKLIILDEIQELTGFDPSGKIERYLRSVIQSLDNTTFIFSGSLPTLLKEMFFNRKRAFYKMALQVSLGFLPANESVIFLLKQFKHLDLKNKEHLVKEIVKTTRGHPYYLQLFGFFLWELTQRKRMKEISVTDILTLVFEQERLAFEEIMSALTHLQRQVFRAICAEPDVPITSHAFLINHRLKGHSSVRQAAKKLEAVGLILPAAKGYIASDPLLALWWKKV